MPGAGAAHSLRLGLRGQRAAGVWPVCLWPPALGLLPYWPLAWQCESRGEAAPPCPPPSSTAQHGARRVYKCILRGVCTSKRVGAVCCCDTRHLTRWLLIGAAGTDGRPHSLAGEGGREAAPAVLLGRSPGGARGPACITCVCAESLHTAGMVRASGAACRR